MAVKTLISIAPGSAWPLDAITSTFAILANRRVGKTYTAKNFAEELCAASLPFVVLDPTGAWWGLRSSADGKEDGYPVIVIGGQHGDIGLDFEAGKQIAEFIVSNPGFYVLDMSLSESGAQQDRFATAFAKRLYRLKALHSDPLMVIVDEADDFIPQKPQENQKQMLGAFDTLNRRGGIRGIGMMLISQRAAVVNKDVLNMTETLIMLRITAPLDQDTVLDWVSRAVDKKDERYVTLKNSLAGLGTGEAWVYSPHFLGTFQKILVREARTFNSSATPKVGQKAIAPQRIAKVDLDKLVASFADTVERSKMEDPAHLQELLREKDGEVIKLQRELKAAKNTAAVPAATPETITITQTRIPDGLLDGLEFAAQALMESAGQLGGITSLIESQENNLNETVRSIRLLKAEVQQIEAAEPVTSISKTHRSPVPDVAVGNVPSKEFSAHSPISKIPVNGDGTLSPNQQLIIDGTALLHALGYSEPEIAQVGMVIGKSHNAGPVRGAFNKLHETGYAIMSGVNFALTPAGRGLAAELNIKSRADIHELWYRRLKGNELEFLRLLINAYPGSMALPEMAAAIGKNINAGPIRGALNSLVHKGLAKMDGDTMTASEYFFPTGLN